MLTAAADPPDKVLCSFDIATGLLYISSADRYAIAYGNIEIQLSPPSSDILYYHTFIPYTQETSTVRYNFVYEYYSTDIEGTADSNDL